MTLNHVLHRHFLLFLHFFCAAPFSKRPCRTTFLLEGENPFQRNVSPRSWASSLSRWVHWPKWDMKDHRAETPASRLHGIDIWIWSPFFLRSNRLLNGSWQCCQRCCLRRCRSHSSAAFCSRRGCNSCSGVQFLDTGVF